MSQLTISSYLKPLNTDEKCVNFFLDFVQHNKNIFPDESHEVHTILNEYRKRAGIQGIIIITYKIFYIKRFMLSLTIFIESSAKSPSNKSTDTSTKSNQGLYYIFYVKLF